MRGGGPIETQLLSTVPALFQLAVVLSGKIGADIQQFDIIVPGCDGLDPWGRPLCLTASTWPLFSSKPLCKAILW